MKKCLNAVCSTLLSPLKNLIDNVHIYCLRKPLRSLAVRKLSFRAGSTLQRETQAGCTINGINFERIIEVPFNFRCSSCSLEAVRYYVQATSPPDTLSALGTQSRPNDTALLNLSYQPEDAVDFPARRHRHCDIR